MLALGLALGTAAVCSFADDYTTTVGGIEYTYTLNGNDATIIYVDPNPTATYTIPSELNSHPVASIGCSAFSYCSGLTSITIPNSVTSIGEMAFSSCYKLTSVTIPNSITSIGNLAFQSCKSLTSIEIPNSVTSIGDSAFSSCSSLTSVTIPNSVTSIGERAFSYCSNLTSVTISKGVTTIKKSAFYNCVKLKRAILPNTINSIGTDAFKYCTSLNTFIESGYSTTNNLLTRTWKYEVLTAASESEDGKTHVKVTKISAFNDVTGISDIAMGDGYVIDEAFGYNGETLTVHIIAAHHPEVAATCTEPGNKEYWSCSDCEKCSSDGIAYYNKTESDFVISINENAHAWGEATYTWADDNNTCTATRVCENNPEHVEIETATSTASEKTPATCAKAGVVTYAAKFTNTAFETQTKEKETPIAPNAHKFPLLSEERVEPTCTEPGHVEGYTCNSCGMHFSDANGATIIPDSLWEINATGHDDPLEHHEAVAPTCTTAGNSEYWSCSKCGKFFSDANGTQKIKADSWIGAIPAAEHTWNDEWNVGDGKHWHECTVCHDAKTDEAEHNLVHEESQDPTNEADGHAAGYTCRVCGKHFSDAEGTQEMSDADWIITKNDGILGDVNGDGIVTSMDMQMVYNIIIGKLQ